MSAESERLAALEAAAKALVDAVEREESAPASAWPEAEEAALAITLALDGLRLLVYPTPVEDTP